MAFQKFDEYLNAKGSISKPKVTTKHSVEGSKGRYVAAPDAENNLTTDKEGGKVSGKGKKKGAKYTAKGKMSENWGKENSELKWEPKTEFKKDTDKFIKSTKDMNMVEFAKYVSSQHLIDEEVDKIPTVSTPHGAFIPAPHELFRTTRFMIMANDKFMESFIREVKRNGGMESLVSELTNHPELYAELAKILAEDENFSKKLVRSIHLNEMVGNPMHKSLPDELDADEDEDEEETEVEDELDMGDETGDDEEEEEEEVDIEDEEVPPMDQTIKHPPVPPALANLRKAMGTY